MTQPNTPDPSTGDPAGNPDPAGTPAEKQDDKPLGPAGERALERIKEERAALAAEIERLKPLAAKAQELEDAGKTETQREREAREAAETRLAEAERRAAAAERGLTAARIAAEIGRPEIAEWLRGDDEDALKADAERLVALLPAGAGAPATPARRDAAAGGANPSTPDMNTLLRIAAGRGA